MARETERITLPGGLLLADGRRLDQAVLAPLTGREEEWLVSHPDTPNAFAVTHLLASCLLGLGDAPVTPEMVRALLVGDRDYLMLQLRRLTLGDRVQAVFTCPSCAAKMDVDFSSSEVPVDRHAQTQAYHAADVGPARSIRFRLPTGADQEAVLSVPPEDRVSALLARCVEQGAIPLSDDEIRAVSSAMESRAPRVDLELDLVCPECGHPFAAPCDMTALFFGEMRAYGRGFLREVHYLAFYYHWSEPEILGLTRRRRREYLALLSETLRPI